MSHRAVTFPATVDTVQHTRLSVQRVSVRCLLCFALPCFQYSVTASIFNKANWVILFYLNFLAVGAMQSLKMRPSLTRWRNNILDSKYVIYRVIMKQFTFMFVMEKDDLSRKCWKINLFAILNRKHVPHSPATLWIIIFSRTYFKFEISDSITPLAEVLFSNLHFKWMLISLLTFFFSPAFLFFGAERGRTYLKNTT